MSRRYEIPGAEPLALEHLLLDVNGTMTDRGELIGGVSERLQRLRDDFAIRLLSADTRGTLDALAESLGFEAVQVETGAEKGALVEGLAAERCAAIGNGRNDHQMLAAARLGVAVIGPEGASQLAVFGADVVCNSITDALDLLIEPSSMASTLRP